MVVKCYFLLSVVCLSVGSLHNVAINEHMATHFASLDVLKCAMINIFI